MDVLRTLLVDDVELARRRLARLLEPYADVQVAGDCGDVESAAEALHTLRPDLVFLDLEMPGANGMELFARVPRGSAPMIVLVTAYEQYAVRAFEAEALDYLLKPVQPQRLEATLARVRDKARERGRQGAVAEWPAQLALRDRGRVVLLAASAIDWVESAGNYLCIRAGEQTHVIREPLVQLQRRLDPRRFVRIHRSRIVNVARIARLEPLHNGDHRVVLHDGTELGLSRTYRDALFSVIEPG